MGCRPGETLSVQGQRSERRKRRVHQQRRGLTLTWATKGSQGNSGDPSVLPGKPTSRGPRTRRLCRGYESLGLV